MNGIQWARTAVCMVIMWAVVELEKAIIDPIMVPLMRPVRRFINRHAPAWLKAPGVSPSRVAGKLCARPRTQSMVMQRKGTLRKSAAAISPEMVAAAAAATNGAEGGNGHAVPKGAAQV